MDGKFALSLEPEVAAEEGLKVEQALPDERIREIAAANDIRRCYNAAAHFLSYRPRSEPEVRQRLKKRGFKPASIDTVMEKLKRQRLVDDTAFARFWTENRQSFSPRSKRLTRLELKQKGIAEDIIEEVVATINDEETACLAAQKKMRSLKDADYQTFRRRMGDYLRRRGFGYEVIGSVINRVWQEKETEYNS